MTQKPRMEHMAGGWLFFAIESLVVIASYGTVLRDDPDMRELPRLAMLTAPILAHIALLWLSGSLFQKRPQILPIYFVVQVVLAFIVGLLTPAYWLAIVLYMGLAGIAIAALWPNIRRVAAVTVLCLGLSSYHLVAYGGWDKLGQFLPSLGLSLAFVVVYVALFTRQTQARAQAQDLLHELEIAHQQLQIYAARVEELTISQERQRMAQELHDTLAQGLAGLILQLDAADSYLEEDLTSLAQETVQRAMARARTTLREARRAIQALRPAALEQDGLIDALGCEVDEFSETTGIEATFVVDADPPDVPPDAAQDILRIIQESLTNVSRHAQADHVVVRLQAHDNQLCVTVEDDGCGFDPDQAAKKQPRSFGLRGLEERAAHLGGTLHVRSAPGRGTVVMLEMERTHDPRADR